MSPHHVFKHVQWGFALVGMVVVAFLVSEALTSYWLLNQKASLVDGEQTDVASPSPLDSFVNSRDANRMPKPLPPAGSPGAVRDPRAAATSLNNDPASASDERTEPEPNVALAEDHANDPENQMAKELQHQLSSVSDLRRRVASLEWEALVLQSDLLARELELESVKQELIEIKASTPVVYNITNVPVGGYVTTAPPVDVREPERNEGAMRQDTALGSVSEGSIPPVQVRQPAFFGPAPDRYEDLIQPSFAQPPDQE